MSAPHSPHQPALPKADAGVHVLRSCERPLPRALHAPSAANTVLLKSRLILLIFALVGAGQHRLSCCALGLTLGHVDMEPVHNARFKREPLKLRLHPQLVGPTHIGYEKQVRKGMHISRRGWRAYTGHKNLEVYE